ncbi:MAG: nuclear transport factor 2 family protein [Bacteroidia bacterium]|jgi:ketosteroid isomerase-like protein|nr:nuclear transport factor 2 family protein [Bacteroidia bacterium]
MHTETASRFYTAFASRNAAEMRNCYHKEVIFNDPVFSGLDYEKVCAMWEMLISRGKDMTLSFEILSSDEEKVIVKWIAIYSFSKTGRKVENHITATLQFRGGLIYRHTDDFDFARWSRMALGLPGILFGRFGFLKKKISATAMQQLEKYMKKQQV